MRAPSQVARPLSGIRVLDLTRLYPGPFATLLLSDLGAQVDKLEDPTVGDYLRHVPPLVGDRGVSAAFEALNRNKRSVALDLKHPEARDTFLRLIERYDVLVEGFRPGTLHRLGLSPEFLRQHVPSLVVCSISGYGQSGPNAAKAGHDLNYVAMTGALGAQGPADAPPAVPGVPLADFGGALYSALAIVAAVHGRSKDGNGAYIDMALADAAFTFVLPNIANEMAGWTVGRARDLLTGGLALYNTYGTKDGRYVALAALEPKFAAAFIEAALGRSFDNAMLIPGPHQDVLQQEIRSVIASKTRDEWDAFSSEVDCCLTPVATLDEVALSTQLRQRGVVDEGASSAHGIPMLRTPLSRDAAYVRPAPRHGEHTMEILREAGMSNDEIDALMASGAVKQPFA